MNKFLCDESGSVVVEYALIAAVLGIGLLLSLVGLQDAIRQMIANIVGKLTA